MLRPLVGPGYGWRHHPAVKMWRGWEEALVRYGLASDLSYVWPEPDATAAGISPGVG